VGSVFQRLAAIQRAEGGSSVEIVSIRLTFVCDTRRGDIVWVCPYYLALGCAMLYQLRFNASYTDRQSKHVLVATVVDSTFG
jgi:hypothetical protein